MWTKIGTFELGHGMVPAGTDAKALRRMQKAMDKLLEARRAIWPEDCFLVLPIDKGMLGAMSIGGRHRFTIERLDPDPIPQANVVKTGTASKTKAKK